MPAIAIFAFCLGLAAWIAVAAPARAHGGGLDKHGCHHDRKHGGYHCHRQSPARAAPPAPPDGLHWRAPDRSPAHLPARKPARLPAHVSPASPPLRYYRNCSAARAAGAAPLRRGDPGYARHLDRDGDGRACE